MDEPDGGWTRRPGLPFYALCLISYCFRNSRWIYDNSPAPIKGVDSKITYHLASLEESILSVYTPTFPWDRCQADESDDAS